MKTPLNILHIEDDLMDASMIEAALETGGLSCKMTVVQGAEEFRAALAKKELDLILSDFSMPRFDGLSALKIARESRPEIPFIFVSGTLGEELAVQALKDGATDYVLKDRMSRLPAAVRRAMREAHQLVERRRMEKELLEASRQAGMAEVATAVLHNVGNVLNSVNISTNLISEQVRNSKMPSLAKVAALLKEHEGDLGSFLANDPKGRQLPPFLAQLAELLKGEQASILNESQTLLKSVEHIKDIVATQQGYARISGVQELTPISELLEDALRMNVLEYNEVEIIREYDKIQPIPITKHKVLQILINLIRNAKHALNDGGQESKRLILRCGLNGNDMVKISVIDNGVGIPPENLERIFTHGFTTKKYGHGFGLHGSILAAKEMGGTLTAHSDGHGTGATFTLELPCHSQPSPTTAEA